ncbi:MAG: tetratricopeptide repeat protein [Magnetococcales bacterium]|nr:sulfotransferase [Magnetococcales bacterium]NGZ25708.1 tetratricopeptide repeat protein [Magnetococcales bacterium]
MTMFSLSYFRIQQRKGELSKAEEPLRHWLTECDDINQRLHGQALLASLLYSQRRLEEGERLLWQILPQQPLLDALGLADLSNCFLLKGDLDQAGFFLQRALLHAPHDGIIHSRLAAWYVKKGELLQALDHSCQALVDLPDLPIQIHNHCRLLATLGKAEEALHYIQRAEELALLPEDLVFMRVDMMLRLGNNRGAEEHAKQAVQEEDPTTVGYSMLTLAQAANDHHGDAGETIRTGLQHYPDDPHLLAMAVELAGNRGLFQEQLFYLQKLLTLEPQKAHWWIQLSQLSTSRLDETTSRQAAEKAIALTEGENGPLRAAALAALASVEAEADHHDLAISLYEQALQCHEQSVQAHMGYGQLLLLLGKMDQAVTHFQHVATFAPGISFSGLVHARHFPQDKNLLQRMEQAALIPGLHGKVKSHILFDLAMACDHSGDHEKAFLLLQQANQASRQFLPYDGVKNRQKISRIIHRFSTTFLEQVPKGVSNQLPVFVLGMPRSGTTLVEQIIASHPLAFGAGELALIPDFIGRLNNWENHLGSGREYPECLDTLTQPILEKMANRLLDELRQFAPSASRIVDKLPHNFENIGLIHMLFPKAAIIHCVRDVRDVALSNYFTDYKAKFGGMGFAYDLKDLGHHLTDYQHVMAHWQQLLPGRILDVHYEKLVEQPEEQARRILEHLGLPWDPQVLNFPELQRPVKTASVWQVRQPIYRTSLGRWRRYETQLQPLLAAMAEPWPPASLPASSTQAGQDFFLEGMEHLKTGRWKEAENSFRQVLLHCPNHAAAHHFLGTALFQQGHHRWALERMRRSVRLHEGHATWWRNLAAVCSHLQLHEDANKAVEKALTLEQATHGKDLPWNRIA